MSTLRPRYAFLAATLSVAVLLSACGPSADSDPGSAPVESPQASPEPSSEPSAPVSPTPPADGVQRQYDAEGLAVFPDRGPAVPTEDLEGAKQAAARYLDEYYKALQTRLDAYLWNNATAGCVYCQTAIGNIEDIRERGIRLGTDAEWTVESTSADLANDEVDYARVVLAVEDPEISLVDDQGVVQVHQSSEGTSNLLVAVRRTEKLWAIVGIEVISAEEAAELNQQWSP